MHDFDRAIPGRQPDPLVPADASTPSPTVARSSSPIPSGSRPGRNGWPTIGPGPYVGISWRSKIQTAERRLEYTRLDEWGDIFATPGVTWVNLQYDDCNRELRDAEKRFGVQIHRWDWLDLMNDFDEVAALMTRARSRRRAVQRGGDAQRRAGRAHRRDGQPLRLGRARFGAHAWQPSIVVASRMPNEEWDEVLATAAAKSRRRDSPTAIAPTKTVEEEHVLDLNGSTILLTGGTGSFGNAFVRARRSTAGPTRPCACTRATS